MEELIPVFREIIASGGSVNFTPKGTSMLPMLHDDADVVLITGAPGKLKRYDLPLYYSKRFDKYIMHRVIGVDPKGAYIMCGDNQLQPEYGVTDEDIIGVVVSFERKGKKYSVNNLSYKLYCRILLCYKRIKRKCLALKRKSYLIYRKIIKNE